MFFKKNKATTLSIYQVEEIIIDGKKLADYDSRKGKFGDIVVDLDSGNHSVEGKFIMTKSKDNQVSDEMKFNITLEQGKNIISVSDKEKHFKPNQVFPIHKKFECDGEELQFYVGILK